MKSRAPLGVLSNNKLASIVSRFALAIASAVAVILPLGYFAVAYSHLAAQTEVEAQGKAGVLSNLVSGNPEFWTYEALRIEELLARFPTPLAEGNTATARDAKGKLIVRVGGEAKAPSLLRSHEIYESGRVVGHVEITRPLNPVLAGTAIATLLGLLLGGAVSVALRVLPMRALQRLTAALYSEQTALRTALTEQQETDAKLRESEHRLDLALEASMLAVWEFDLTTGDVSLSRHWWAIVGYAPGEVPARSDAWEKLTHPDDIANLRQKMGRHFKGADPTLIVEYRIRCKSGEWKWIRTVGRVVERDAAGRARRATGVHGDVTLRRQQEDRLSYLAYYDPLTGLANRNRAHERLSAFVGDARDTGRKLAVLMIDLERFRSINETLGRGAGDDLLKQFADRNKVFVTEEDWFARIGPDQFATTMRDLAPADIAARIEQRLTEVLDAPFTLGEAVVRVAVKIGIALFPDHGDDADALFRNAEAALNKAKSSGERYLFYASEMTAGVAENLALENRLREALRRDEFVLHYQPKVDIETRRIVGVEALIRWQSPELGLVPPMKFIPLMEETGLILEAGAWALRQAVSDHRLWAGMSLPAPRVAVNVSAVQLRRKDFVAMVRDAIVEGASPTGIDLEITESLMMQDMQGNIEKLKLLRSLGMGIAIDDFGTGHSSLAYLAKLPIQSLKIDRSFIITMLHEPETMTLVSTIISLAHSMRLNVVAEGVDEEEQAKILRLLRCNEMQGYLFSRPVPFDQMTALLSREPKG